MAHAEDVHTSDKHQCCHGDHQSGGIDAPQIVGGAGYTCPMHPEVRSSAPGPCPKCGMALEPVNPVAAAEVVEYTCPMHPEIVRDEPGSCPICGMALEPRAVRAGEEKTLSWSI